MPEAPGQTWRISFGEVPTVTATTAFSPPTSPTLPHPAAVTLDPRHYHLLLQRKLRLREGDQLAPKHQSIYWLGLNPSSLTGRALPGTARLADSSNSPSTVSAGSGLEVVYLQTWTVPRGWNQVP